MQGNNGLSRATLKKALRNCAEPAPVPQDANIADGANPVSIQGLLIDPSTGILFAPIVNTGTVLTPGAKDITPSSRDTLGTFDIPVTLTNTQAGDTYAVFLLGACARKVYVGTFTVV